MMAMVFPKKMKPWAKLHHVIRRFSPQDEAYATWSSKKHLPRAAEQTEHKELGESMSRLWCLGCPAVWKLEDPLRG